MNRTVALARMYTVATLTLLGSCGRNSQPNDDVNALKDEVKNLKSELERQKASSTPSSATSLAVSSSARVSGATSDEYKELIRVSRRTVSALGTGVKYRDFSQRLVEVNASTEEALPKISDRAQRAKIADFVLALNDARILWAYKISSGQDRMPLQSIVQGYYSPQDYPQELGDRWNRDFPDLVEKYGLRVKDPVGSSPIIDYGGHPSLLFDRALERIFAFATKQFREIDGTQD